MPKKRKEGTVNTTISVSWRDKNLMRKLARKRKTTKNGDVYESDSVIFNRILQDYMIRHKEQIRDETTATYPEVSRDVSQQG